MYVIYFHCWESKARVHKTYCRYVTRRNKLGSCRGVWSAAITSLDLALRQAKQITKSKDVAACSCCKRR